MEPLICEGFSVEPDRRELVKLLGERRLTGDAAAGAAGGEEKSPGENATGIAAAPGGEDETVGYDEEAPGDRAARIDAALAAALAAARTLVEPKGIWRIVKGAELDAPADIAALERVAVCVCTIGGALEEAVKVALDGGRMLEGIALDAVGSAAAEAAARYMNERIGEAAAAEGLGTSCRVSPGYGGWNVAAQRRIFELVPAGRIGVTLTPGCMMVPRKSVSFVVHIAAEPARLRGENSCRECDLDNCPYRRDD